MPIKELFASMMNKRIIDKNYVNGIQSYCSNDKVLPINEVAGCKVVKMKTFTTTEAGELSFFEGSRDIGFDIKRIYYISEVPKNMWRGFHAHKHLKQILFCPYGKIELFLEDGHTRESIILSDPSVAVIIDKPIWREMKWLKKDSVLVVGASEYYTPDDYIRDYEDFKTFVGR